MPAGFTWADVTFNQPSDVAAINALGNAVESLLSDAWTTYNPAWTALTTNPAIGNGTVTGRYMQIGKLFVFTGNITMGSTTTFGSGTWQISLPLALQSVVLHAGTAWTYDDNGIARPAALWIAGGVLRITAVSGGDVGPTNPQTWAVNDQARWTFIGEAA